MYISAGHSNSDPGAVANGRKEADIACEVRNMVSFYLQRAGVKHEVDGVAVENASLRDVVKRSRLHKLSVEFHCNASSNPAATGVEVLCAPKDAARAAAICNAISKVLGIRNRGVKPENSGQHSRLAFIQAGGMIVEVLFITNKGDLARYDANKWLMAREVARCLV